MQGMDTAILDTLCAALTATLVAHEAVGSDLTGAALTTLARALCQEAEGMGWVLDDLYESGVDLVTTWPLVVDAWHDLHPTTEQGVAAQG